MSSSPPQASCLCLHEQNHLQRTEGLQDLFAAVQQSRQHVTLCVHVKIAAHEARQGVNPGSYRIKQSAVLQRQQKRDVETEELHDVVLCGCEEVCVFVRPRSVPLKRASFCRKSIPRSHTISKNTSLSVQVRADVPATNAKRIC